MLKKRLSSNIHLATLATSFSKNSLDKVAKPLEQGLPYFSGHLWRYPVVKPV